MNKDSKNEPAWVKEAREKTRRQIAEGRGTFGILFVDPQPRRHDIEEERIRPPKGWKPREPSDNIKSQNHPDVIPSEGKLPTISPHMHPAYFETRFVIEDSTLDWPGEFAIITAYATTGEVWTPAQNQAADRQLEAELRASGVWLRRATGFSPTTGHAEPGWAVALSLDRSLEIGLRYRQDAIYWISGDALALSFCDPAKRALFQVGSFRGRLSQIIGTLR